MGDDDSNLHGPPAPVQLGPALPFLDWRLTKYLNDQIAGGAAGVPGTHFSVEPRDDKHLYDSLTAALAPYVSEDGIAIARTTVRGVPLTLSVNPSLDSVMVMLEGKFG
jgi:hypothetical protein